jgi:hypothetical protein
VLIAEGLSRQGETARAAEIYKEAEAIVESTSLESMFGRGG